MSEHFDKLGWLDFFLRGAHDLSHAEFRVLTILFSYSSSKDGGEIRPGLSRIIKDCCISRNTAKAALKTLQDKGYIIQVRAGGNQTGKGYANVYQLGRPEHRTSYPQGDQPLTPRGPTIGPLPRHIPRDVTRQMVTPPILTNRRTTPSPQSNETTSSTQCSTSQPSKQTPTTHGTNCST